MPTMKLGALVFSIALAAASLSSCTNANSVATGAARVVVRPLLPDSSIARIVINVGPGSGTPTFSPIVAELAPSGAQWIARVPGIPAGQQRQFDAIAFDSHGIGIYATSARVDIAAGSDTIVSISLQNRPPSFSSAFPIIDAISWTPDPPAPGSEVHFRVTAHDSDPAQKLSYLWTGDCGTFQNPTSATPAWTAPFASVTCHLTIAVSDTIGSTVGYDFAIRVVSTAGDAGVTVSVNSWPVISSLSGVLSVRNSTMDGDLAIQASDPDNDPLSYTWESTCGGIVFKLTPPYGPTAPHITLPLASAPCTIIVSVYDGFSPRPTTGTLFISPEVVRVNCENVVCPAGQSCDLNDGICKPCTANCAGRMCGSDGCSGTCGTCPAGQACNATNQCISVCVPACSGKNCGPDGCGRTCGSCDPSLQCSSAGLCVSRCTPSCPANSCGSDGCGSTCVCPTGTTCGAGNQCTAACTPACTGKQCGPDGCGGSCGTCATGTCSSGGQCVCTPSCPANTCGPDGCGGTCACPSGTSCNSSQQCVAACTPACSGKQCGSDGCGGSCGTCASGTCSASGQCVSTAPAVTPSVARDLPIQSPGFVAMDTGGNSVVASVITNPIAANFQTNPSGPAILLSSQNGSSNIILARYDATGNIVWGETIGDDDPTQTTNQNVSAAGFTNDGKIAFTGPLTGSVTMGSSVIIGASTVQYVAAVSSADGARLWGKGFDLGSNGLLAAIGTNPNSSSNRIAVCGSASKAATQLVPGTTFGGVVDLVVAVFDSAGNKLWAMQLGGAGTERCTAIAIDDNGDVFAAGQYDGTTLSFCPTGPSSNGVTCTGAPITITGPGTSSQKYMWLAKFAGGTGNTIAAKAYSGSVGAISPSSLAVNGAGDVALGGSFTGNPTIGAALPDQGGSDAFLVKLHGSDLSLAWNAIAWGGTGNDLLQQLAFSPSGDILAVGTVAASSAAFRAANVHDTVGAVSLDVSGTSNTDVFVVNFNGQTGALQHGTTYGDPQVQTGQSIACNRSASGLVTFSAAVVGSATFGTAGTITPSLGKTDIALVFSKLQ